MGQSIQYSPGFTRTPASGRLVLGETLVIENVTLSFAKIMYWRKSNKFIKQLNKSNSIYSFIETQNLSKNTLNQNLLHSLTQTYITKSFCQFFTQIKEKSLLKF